MGFSNVEGVKDNSRTLYGSGKLCTMTDIAGVRCFIRMAVNFSASVVRVTVRSSDPKSTMAIVHPSTFRAVGWSS